MIGPQPKKKRRNSREIRNPNRISLPLLLLFSPFLSNKYDNTDFNHECFPSRAKHHQKSKIKKSKRKGQLRDYLHRGKDKYLPRFHLGHKSRTIHHARMYFFFEYYSPYPTYTIPPSSHQYTFFNLPKCITSPYLQYLYKYLHIVNSSNFTNHINIFLTIPSHAHAHTSSLSLTSSVIEPAPSTPFPPSSPPPPQKTQVQIDLRIN